MGPGKADLEAARGRLLPDLHASGFTRRQLRPEEQGDLLALGLGLTNVAPRATARADELGADELGAAELAAGGGLLREKVLQHRPRWLAVLGVTAYRSAFGRRRAVVGPQEERIGDTDVWVLPNPSGLNAHWAPPALAAEFARLRAAAAR